MKRSAKPLRRVSKKREKALREARATFGKATGPCEMLPFLGAVTSWHRWIGELYDGNWRHPDFGVFEWHHPFGQRWHDESWNRMRVCRPAHSFEDRCFGSAGFVVCLTALKERGELLDDGFYLASLGWSPLGKVSNWLEDGLFKANPERGSVGEPVLRRYAERLVG